MPDFLVPSPSASGIPVGLTDAELDFFGSDILFTSDLQVTAYGDYAEVVGYEALKQAIKIRLMVCPGEYAVHPDFGIGLPLYVKKRATPADLDDLRQKIINQLGQEDRIEKVETVNVERADRSADMPGIKILIKVRAFGRVNSFGFTSFTE